MRGLFYPFCVFKVFLQPPLVEWHQFHASFVSIDWRTKESPELLGLEAESILMRKLVVLLCFATIVFSFSSCATIIGGAKYNAKVQVPNHPDAIISVNGEWKGKGEANFLVNRKDANKLNITVQEENCEPETMQFSKRTFRGWAFVGTLVGWTFYLTNAPYVLIPAGVVVDACTGAWWKPDVTEKGVSKIDYDNFLYTITYKAIPKKETVIMPEEINKGPMDSSTKSKAEILRELKQLFDDGVLTQEEYEKEKAKVLESKE